VKKRENAQNMNGIPVCLARKTENAPTRGPRKANFRTLVGGCFSTLSGINNTPLTKDCSPAPES